MLSFEEYTAEVKALPFGKRVGKNVYVLWPDLKEASPLLSKLLEPIGRVDGTSLIKFFLDHYKVSFLQYPDFFSNPHPALHRSETLNLNTGKRRVIDYTKQKNPPILHRKETMIAPDRPEYTEWAELTKVLEGAGCYAEPKKIGYKEYWESVLETKGLAYNGHQLYTVEHNGNTHSKEQRKIDRHKTAMSRADFFCCCTIECIITQRK